MIDFSFAVVSARTEAHAASPTIVLRLRLTASPAQRVHTGLLRCLIQIRSAAPPVLGRRGRPPPRFFGEPVRWHETMKPLFFTQVAIVVPGFEGSVDVDVPVPAPSDVATAAAKYFHGLDGGEAAIVCQFSGTIFIAAPGGYQVTQIPWDLEASFRLPVEVWREAMDEHFPTAPGSACRARPSTRCPGSACAARSPRGKPPSTRSARNQKSGRPHDVRAAQQVADAVLRRLRALPLSRELDEESRALAVRRRRAARLRRADRSGPVVRADGVPHRAGRSRDRRRACPRAAGGGPDDRGPGTGR